MRVAVKGRRTEFLDRGRNNHFFQIAVIKSIDTYFLQGVSKFNVVQVLTRFKTKVTNLTEVNTLDEQFARFAAVEEGIARQFCNTIVYADIG